MLAADHRDLTDIDGAGPAESGLIKAVHRAGIRLASADRQAREVLATGYSREECWGDYQRLALYTLVYPVFTASLIDPSAAAQKQALGVILTRGFEAARRLGSADLLSGN